MQKSMTEREFTDIILASAEPIPMKMLTSCSSVFFTVYYKNRFPIRVVKPNVKKVFEKEWSFRVGRWPSFKDHSYHVLTKWKWAINMLNRPPQDRSTWSLQTSRSQSVWFKRSQAMLKFWSRQTGSKTAKIWVVRNMRMPLSRSLCLIRHSKHKQRNGNSIVCQDLRFHRISVWHSLKSWDFRDYTAQILAVLDPFDHWTGKSVVVF